MPAGWVSAGAAAIGAGESIAGNMAAQKTTAANNANAATLNAGQNQMLNQAEQVANQPFVAYQGQLTAPLSGNQQQALSMASSAASAGQGQADVNAGTTLLASEQPWNASTEAQYANPYTQDVVNAALGQQQKSYLQSIAANDTGAGATDSFGNARNAIENADLTANNTLNTATTTANLNANAYTAATQAWQADNQAKTAAANAYMNAGNDVTQMTDNQIQQLLQTGGVAQVTAQTNLQNEYGQFMRQQGWSAQQLGPLMTAVGTAKGSGTYQTPIQSNVGNSLLGLGSTLAGLYGGGTGSNNSSAGLGLGANQSTAGFNMDTSNLGTNLVGSDSSTVSGLPSTLSGTGAGGYFSDAALKHYVDFKYYNPASRLAVYDFNFKSDPPGTPKTRGYLAQEVARQYPHAVTRGEDGYLRVDYSKIPGWDELERLGRPAAWDHWVQVGEDQPLEEAA